MKYRAAKINQRKLNEKSPTDQEENEYQKNAVSELQAQGPVDQLPLTPRNTVRLQRVIGNDL